MASIATLVWMRVKADHASAALREGPAGHSSGAVGPIAETSAAADFPNACSFFLPTSTDGPMKCCKGRFFVCAGRLSQSIPCSVVQNSPFEQKQFLVPLRREFFGNTPNLLSNSRRFLGLGKRFREIACFFPDKREFRVGVRFAAACVASHTYRFFRERL